MIDVFVRVFVSDDIRRAFFDACFARWEMQKDARVYLLIGEMIGPSPHYCGSVAVPDIEFSPDSFHIDSKRKAEELAQSEIYCVIDDDQLILGQDFIRKGVENLGNHPQYGMLSATSISDGIFPEGRTRPSCDVVEMHAIGCPYFVRKGTLKEFPKGPKEQYDGILSKVVTDQGLKTGLMPYVRYNHLGAGYSKACPEHWSA